MLRNLDEDDPLAVAQEIQAAGSFGDTVVRAAEFAELPVEAVSILRMAAQVVERHACGYMPQDTAVARLSATLTTFVQAMRDRFIAQEGGPSAP